MGPPPRGWRAGTEAAVDPSIAGGAAGSLGSMAHPDTEQENLTEEQVDHADEVLSKDYRQPELEHLQPENNAYNNPFGTEIALFRTSEGGMARMAVSWDTPGEGGERGRIRTRQGTYYSEFQSGHDAGAVAELSRPPLPPGVDAGGHGGSHGYLMSEFVEAILMDRTPLIDVAQALNMTVGGIVAHESALKGGELLKIPQYAL